MNVRDNTTEAILKLYAKYGLGRTLQICNRLLAETEVGSKDRESKNIIKGELAEVSLECILLALQDRLNFQTAILKSIFVEDTYSDLVTELDLTFITPYAIYLFECKSYSGKNKTVRGECELFRENESIRDVTSQNKLHLNLFNRKYGGFVRKGSKPYRVIVYNYASEKFKDKRKPEYKRKMPVLNQDSVVDWVVADLKTSQQFEISVDVVNMVNQIEKDCKAYDKIYGKRHREQLGY